VREHWFPVSLISAHAAKRAGGVKRGISPGNGWGAQDKILHVFGGYARLCSAAKRRTLLKV
jgi:hypothetical protein